MKPAISLARLTLPNGRVVDSHMVRLVDEAMRQSLSAALVEGATHVVTIRGGTEIKAGDTIVIDGASYDVLAAYDPYDRHGVAVPEPGDFADIKDAKERQRARDAAEGAHAAALDEIRNQRGKWTKILIRKE
jgi:hypothetical protein